MFFRNFWSGISGDKQYSTTFTTTVGGTVSPDGFFAKANAMKSFVVTPDSHHAIHSVKAYNTDTNQQFSLQEYSPDLQTGAKTYSFNMPSANIRIIVEFSSIEITIPVTATYTSPQGKTYTTSFNLLYDNSN